MLNSKRSAYSEYCGIKWTLIIIPVKHSNVIKGKFLLWFQLFNK